MMMSTALAIRLAGQSTAPERQLVTRAADALGGRDRVMALSTLQIIGYGELAYFNGGGNITGDPAAPQKWQKVLEYTRTIDLEHWRTRVQQRLKMDFVFASTIGQLGLNRTNETLDGDVAYNIGFHTAPHEHSGQYHWHVHLWPNLVTQAGFERGTGVMINVVPPEDAAATLRVAHAAAV